MGSIFFQTFCYLIMAPLNRAANLCILFQMWTLKSGEVYWRHCLDHKPEMHSQSWLVIITSSRFALIIMLPGPLYYKFLALLQARFLHWLPQRAKLSWAVLFKSESTMCTMYLVLLTTLNFTNYVNLGKLWNIFECRVTYLKGEINNTWLVDSIIIMLTKRSVQS